MTPRGSLLGPPGSKAHAPAPTAHVSTLPGRSAPCLDSGLSSQSSHPDTQGPHLKGQPECKGRKGDVPGVAQRRGGHTAGQPGSASALILSPSPGRGRGAATAPLPVSWGSGKSRGARHALCVGPQASRAAPGKRHGLGSFARAPAVLGQRLGSRRGQGRAPGTVRVAWTQASPWPVAASCSSLLQQPTAGALFPRVSTSPVTATVLQDEGPPARLNDPHHQPPSFYLSPEVLGSGLRIQIAT